MAQLQDLSDHLHDSVFVSGDFESGDPGHFERIADFDWESVCHNVDGESIEDSKVSFSDMSAVLSLIIGWALGGETLLLAGARLASLGVFLDPIHNAKFGKNLSEIAREAGCTRQALSKSLVGFRDACGIVISGGKLHGSRAKFSRIQRDLIADGKHASDTRKAKKLASG